MDGNQDNTLVTATQLLTGIILPILVATAIVGPIVVALGKGILWGVKEE